MAEWIGSFYRVQVRSARAAQLGKLGECRRPRPITFPFSLSLPPILPPGSLPSKEAPAGSYRLLLHFPPPGPSRDRNQPLASQFRLE